MREINLDVFDKLRSWIIEGRFQEGQYINLGELCCSLKVSQVPVREVLIRLSERGLLTWERKRGFKISSCDLYECASILQMKRTIFTNAINRLSPLYLSPHHLKNIRDRINSTSSVDLGWAELSDIFLEYNRMIMSEFEFHVFQISYDRIHEYHRRMFDRHPDKISLRLALLQKTIEYTYSFRKHEALTSGQQFIDDDVQSICQTI
ncbi:MULTISPECIES: GntR family transcriptional regulator [unclassified Brenneria]|uniref:GntR family transcriptional regulator n=1 Tax=unclassified Brenneria TaxID=2634434 RepID=UPI0029C3E438|nr:MULTISPECIES: GntR family transcriptional regulator [unclassified Brenneria]MDX5627103.1 GntR family transcriptional regulator [Brenneria sp. L3-3Z]MDX5693547.1 GntR family transcriptional regulator [Brenneria sp. L4-2C]